MVKSSRSMDEDGEKQDPEAMEGPLSGARLGLFREIHVFSLLNQSNFHVAADKFLLGETHLTFMFLTSFNIIFIIIP